LIIFGILMALFAAAYWACGGHAKPRKASGTIPTAVETRRASIEP
jgi:hypothetical protein